MNKKYLISFFISGLILFTSCSSYLISVDSLKEQFSGIDSTKLINVNVRGPIGETYSYLANSIQSIKCKDKNGKPHELINSPS
ncbi:MAG: hypothetical protein VB110_10640, partial [Bacteroidales bacterium]|nr:hypothetical protein [Bacteroidales bacterium]